MLPDVHVQDAPPHKFLIKLKYHEDLTYKQEARGVRQEGPEAAALRHMCRNVFKFDSDTQTGPGRVRHQTTRNKADHGIDNVDTKRQHHGYEADQLIERKCNS